jgi:adenosylhomocysteine nucleosidase
MSRIDPKKTLIVMALRQESQGLMEELNLPLLFSGVGLIKATQKLTQHLTSHKYERVLNLGTAGSRKWPQKSLLEVQKAVRRDQVLGWMNQEINLQTLTDLPKGICGSADFVDTTPQVDKWDMLDMEAYALASVCHDMKIPFHSVKYITDLSDAHSQKDWESLLVPAALEFKNLLLRLTR